MAKLVVVIQCDIVQKKCVGYACMKSFYERSGRFNGYDADTRYLTITCGGCCGRKDRRSEPEAETLGR